MPIALALVDQVCAQPFTKNTNQSRKLRSILAGGSGNSIPASTQTAVISGGVNNTASGPRSTVSGGQQNTAGSEGASWATVGGGYNNTASAHASTIAGGSGNVASIYHATVAGGSANAASGPNATVGGGHLNTASGSASTVPGGFMNTAAHRNSFAAGNRAKTTDPGQFVWADGQDKDFAPVWANGTNTFNVRARGGVRFDSGDSGFNQTIYWRPGNADWDITSDSAAKENFQQIDTRDVLRRLASLPITEWNFKGHTQRNIGPMAQDWHKAFPSLSTSDKVINSGDLQGVSLVAIQGLVEELKDRDKAIGELKAELRALREEVRGKSPPAE